MKKNGFLSLFICLLLIPAFSAPADEKRPMSVDDALNMIRVGTGLLAPDGSWLLYSQAELDWDKNKRQTKYFKVDTQGGTPRQYLSSEGGSAFAFSPDNRFLAFKRKVEKKDQLFLMPNSGGEAMALTEHESGVRSFEWLPDSSGLIFSADEAREKEEEKDFQAGNDSFFVDEEAHGQTHGAWLNLWRIGLNPGPAERLSREKAIISEFTVAPDGEKILIVARYSNRRNDGGKNELYLQLIGSQEWKRLTDNEVPESSPVWSPDSRTFYYLAADEKEWKNRDDKIFRMSINDLRPQLVSGQFPGTVTGPALSTDGRALFFNGTQGTASNLFRLEPATGRIRKLSSLPGTLQVLSYSADRNKVAYVYSDYKTPPDLYTSSTREFKPIRLTRANPWLEKDVKLAEMQLERWSSKDGMEIEGLVYHPLDRKPEAPLLLHIHGGPAGSFNNAFNPDFHIYAGLGYRSLAPNVRGSTGYGDQLREGNTVAAGDGIGLGDYEDLMTGVDHLIAKGWADPEKLALRGWSYGAILGGWTITRTDRFKAASLGAGVYDWSSEYGMGFNHDIRLWHIGGTPWDNPEAYRFQSAYTHVLNVKTPTFLTHGTADFTDTEGQSMLFFTALKDIGRAPVRYLRVPREGHVYSEPRHQRRFKTEEIRWLEKYVMGRDWTAPERKAEKKKAGRRKPRPGAE